MRTTHQERIFLHLRLKGAISSLEAINEYGITRLAAVIFELRCKGNNIISERRTVTNRYGDDCQVAFYKLIGE